MSCGPASYTSVMERFTALPVVVARAPSTLRAAAAPVVSNADSAPRAAPGPGRAVVSKVESFPDFPPAGRVFVSKASDAFTLPATAAFSLRSSPPLAGASLFCFAPGTTLLLGG